MEPATQFNLWCSRYFRPDNLKVLRIYSAPYYCTLRVILAPLISETYISRSSRVVFKLPRCMSAIPAGARDHVKRSRSDMSRRPWHARVGPGIVPRLRVATLVPFSSTPPPCRTYLATQLGIPTVLLLLNVFHCTSYKRYASPWFGRHSLRDSLVGMRHLLWP